MFRQSRFVHCHSCISINSLLIISTSCLLKGPEQYTVVSSANDNMLNEVQLCKSLMYTRKRIGHKIDPCGTPVEICLKLDLQLFICHAAVYYVMYLVSGE